MDVAQRIQTLFCFLNPSDLKITINVPCNLEMNYVFMLTVIKHGVYKLLKVLLDKK